MAVIVISLGFRTNRSISGDANRSISGDADAYCIYVSITAGRCLRVVSCGAVWCLQIVYESPSVMLVNKPAGVPAHATVDNFAENMLAGLRREENRIEEKRTSFGRILGVVSDPPSLLDRCRCCSNPRMACSR